MNYKLNREADWLDQLRQTNWSVSRLAKLCTISQRTLQRHFLKIMGQTPKEWLTQQRLRQARESLHGGATVKETASLMGYKHATTFAREFKKSCGQCPKSLANPPKIKVRQPRDVA